MALVTYPLNNLDYAAEDAELFHCTRSSGIYAGDDFNYSVTGADNTITIGVGLGWIRNSKFSGKVIALKAAVSLDLGLADSAYPRIDAVVLQFDANKNSTDVVIKQGTAASSPSAPEISRTEALYELHLYHVRREAGATAVTASNVTDLRLDPNYCGLMADSVTQVDTTAINAQIQAFIERLRQEIAAVEDGSAYALAGHNHDEAYAAKTHNHDETYSPKNHSHTAADVGAITSAGGEVTGYLDFADTNKGLAWKTANGTIIHFRPYSPSNTLQITFDGGPWEKETGVLNISTETGTVSLIGLKATGQATLQGPLVLTEGVHYGTEAQRPAAGTKGRIYFQEVT